ncbi:hypothetical protein Pla110_16360 [Polystyrenella longa]|uniref:HEAT repeat protein n=1 Tax=Polystyrenella longa TaxID=2528007 RepID=A0A518CL19_9PLAN|nr:hypothetical protein [Polystyrenella longa]QDU79916.1 hypothetical protein Pla110_16360 [Polystyrenella longa]
MPKFSSQFTIIGAGLFGVIMILTNLSGCGQDRPGVRFTEDSERTGDYVDLNSPEMLEQKLTHLIGLVKGESANKARRSATTLGSMGAKAAPVLDDLKVLKDHPIEEVRVAIQGAIEKIEADINKPKEGGE